MWRRGPKRTKKGRATLPVARHALVRTLTTTSEALAALRVQALVSAVLGSAPEWAGDLARARELAPVWDPVRGWGQDESGPVEIRS